MIKRVLATLLLFAAASLDVNAQSITSQNRRDIAQVLDRIVRREVVTVKNVEVERTAVNGKRLTVYASIDMSYYPFREDNIAPIYDSIRAVLPEQFEDYEISIVTDRHHIEDLVPRALREKEVEAKERFTNRSARPLVTRLSSQSQPTHGLAGRHIAMWQSHGYMFDNGSAGWGWQRARLWQTVEDLYTQSYVVPYLVPMLENAGANVMLPRERDVQKAEVIVDNDVRTESVYDEYTGDRTWYTGAKRGFAARREFYTEAQNPFTEGSYRASECVKEGADESRIVWTPAIPEEGEYAVYVSYKSERNSADDALYTVHHLGGATEFSVNQQMGGGTWIYLGTFRFAEGVNEASGCVTLSNRSAHGHRKVVTADAVKFGGGMGNIARIPVEKKRNPELEYEHATSGAPRFVEGARYWLQWAGFPEKVYNLRENADDYRDDYMSRAHWVNYVMGGSERAKDSMGLAVPLDMVFAFHSDAGIKEDSIVGTLGIFYTRENGGRYDGGSSRYLSRDLTDMVLTDICRDVRALHAPEWSRRGLWNRSYYEARVPSVPTMLLELLSHQNFNDMRYGLDPRFRFTVSRAIYKGILRYLSFQYDRPYVVQPLPVEAFAAQLTDEGVRLTWQPQIDSLEPTAMPDRYVVYTRVGDAGFDNGRVVEGTECVLPLPADAVVSYRITAVNAGGESFPSETLSACRVSESKGTVLVVNGFDRVSAPVSYRDEGTAGFMSHIDGGVADRRDISYIGAQRGFFRSTTYDNNYDECLGSCYSDYAFEVLAGNTFDYAKVHGEAIINAGYSFCSVSAASVERGAVMLADYSTVDLILGKQLSTVMGEGASGVDFQTFVPAMQLAVRHFTSQGGRIFVSGSYVATDLWNSPGATADGQKFAREVLHYRLQGGRATTRGAAAVKRSQAKLSSATYCFNTELNNECYAVESPDAILPADKQSFVVMQYPDCGLGAAVGYKGDYRSLVVGFPFETITDEESRNRLMSEVLTFLNE